MKNDFTTWLMANKEEKEKKKIPIGRINTTKIKSC